MTFFALFTPLIYVFFELSDWGALLVGRGGDHIDDASFDVGNCACTTPGVNVFAMRPSDALAFGAVPLCLMF